MYKSLKIALTENNINFPNFWDQKLSVEFFISTDSEDLDSELKVTPAILKIWIKNIFPDKPKNISIKKYLQSILVLIIDVEDEVVLEVESAIDVEFTKHQDNFMTIYKKGFFNKALIAALSEEDRKAYEVFASSMQNSESYKE